VAKYSLVGPGYCREEELGVADCYSEEQEAFGTVPVECSKGYCNNDFNMPVTRVMVTSLEDCAAACDAHGCGGFSMTNWFAGKQWARSSYQPDFLFMGYEQCVLYFGPVTTHFPGPCWKDDCSYWNGMTCGELLDATAAPEAFDAANPTWNLCPNSNNPNKHTPGFDATYGQKTQRGDLACFKFDEYTVEMSDDALTTACSSAADQAILTEMDACADDATFTDAKGYGCTDWAGYDCDAFPDEYTNDERAAVYAGCPDQCGVCWMPMCGLSDGCATELAVALLTGRETTEQDLIDMSAACDAVNAEETATDPPITKAASDEVSDSAIAKTGLAAMLVIPALAALF